MKSNPGAIAGVVAMLCIALAVCWIGYQQTTTQKDLAKVVEVTVWNTDQITARDRVVDLPDDGGYYYTSVFVHADWQSRPQERQLVASFEVEPALVSLKAQTNYNVTTTDSEIFKERWEGYVDAPAVVIQDEAGQVIWKASGTDIPQAEAMAPELVQLFNKRPWLKLRPWKRPRPCPCPTPQPQPEPDKVKPDKTVVVKIPDLRPLKKQEAAGSDVWVVLAVACVLAAVLAVVFQFKARVD